VSTNRLETFADGVFAIAATLLILNVDAQVGDGSGAIGHRLLAIWPSYSPTRSASSRSGSSGRTTTP